MLKYDQANEVKVIRQIGRINVSYVIMFNYEYKCPNQRVFYLMFTYISHYA